MHETSASFRFLPPQYVRHRATSCPLPPPPLKSPFVPIQSGEDDGWKCGGGGSLGRGRSCGILKPYYGVRPHNGRKGGGGGSSYFYQKKSSGNYLLWYSPLSPITLFLPSSHFFAFLLSPYGKRRVEGGTRKRDKASFPSPPSKIGWGHQPARQRRGNFFPSLPLSPFPIPHIRPLSSPPHGRAAAPTSCPEIGQLATDWTWEDPGRRKGPPPSLSCVRNGQGVSGGGGKGQQKNWGRRVTNVFLLFPPRIPGGGGKEDLYLSFSVSSFFLFPAFFEKNVFFLILLAFFARKKIRNHVRTHTTRWTLRSRVFHGLPPPFLILSAMPPITENMKQK